MYTIAINGVIGEDFKYTDLLLHLNNAKNEMNIRLLIDSLGGYVTEGLRMRDLLKKTGKNFISENSGNVASIAVGLFLVSPKSQRKFNPAKGRFLIHNPYADGVTGDADKLTEYSKQLKSFEKELIKQYEIETGSNAEILAEFMKEEIFLTPEQIESLGFATIINESELVAKAFFNNNHLNTNNKMNDEQTTILEKIWNKLENLFSPKNMMLKDVTGLELEFSDEIQTQEQIVVGVTAKQNGQPANGEFVMPDGRTLVFENGTLTVVKTIEDNSAKEAQVVALKAEIEELKAKNETLTTENTTLKTNLSEIKNQVEKFKALSSNGKTPENKPTEKKEEKTQQFKLIKK